jgi:predicted O-methyltransferase YrrM
MTHTPPPPRANPLDPPPPLPTRVALKLKRIYRELGKPRMERDWSDAWPLIDSIEGWMLPGEERRLFELAYSLPTPASIVEIGSFKGRSTCALALGCRSARNHVFAIDTFDGNGWDLDEHDFFGQFSRNMARCGVTDRVRPLVGRSVDIGRDWSGPIHMLFIDGAHEYEAVKSDFEAFFRHVVPGGIVAFHDVIENWPGPLRFWGETVKGQLIETGHWRSLAHGRKRP